MANNRRGKTRPGQSYKDPIYDQIEAKLEKKYGLPPGLMKGIRTRGERSNADQVSPVGARTVYQIMPNTRGLFKKTYGVDAYSSLEGAAEVAALHLRDDIKKTGSATEAVRRYIGGPDPRQHGPVTRAYVKRVTGEGSDISVPAGTNGAVALKPGLTVSDFSIDDILNIRPDDLGNTRRPLGPNTDPKPTATEKRIARNKAITGGTGVQLAPENDQTSDISEGQAVEQAQVDQQTLADSESSFDVMKAAMGDWFGSSIIDAFGDAHPEVEEGFGEFYLKNWETIEAKAQSTYEVEQLREARSKDDLMSIGSKIFQDRERNAIIDRSEYPTLTRLGAGLVDPIGWAAGAGVGKAFQTVGLGGRVLAAQGRTGAAVGATALEGAVGNLAFTGALDAAGEQVTGADYLISSVAGLGIGAMMSPLVIRGARQDDSAMEAINDLVAVERENVEIAVSRAKETLGPDATPEQLTEEVNRTISEETRATLDVILADVPDDMRFLSGDEELTLTADKAVKEDVISRSGLNKISDDTERSMVAEIVARAERMVADNPIDESALNTSLRHVKAASTGVTLLRSEGSVGKAIGMMLLEGTTGAAGRRRTAAMSRDVRERLYNRHMMEFDSLHAQFRKGEGISLARDLWDFKARKQFNRRVMLEIEARGGTTAGTTFDTNPAVIRAADIAERGFNVQRIELQHVDAVGSARLGVTSRGYFPHRLDAGKVANLSDEELKNLNKILARQFEENNGFDRAFSKKLAVKYLEKARERANGAYDVPFNLHSPEAADIVRDSLEALKIPDDEIEKLLGKYSRGGAGFTKKRLKLDLTEDIGNGRQLVDLFNQDVASLYRSNARRASGEVALAQFGVMGKKGLNVLRKALAETSGPNNADAMKAFDQIAAEFLNTPFGSWNHAFMDNVRTATSAARLGGMGFTQASEYGNAIASVGVMRTLSSIGSFNRLRKEVAHLAKSGEAANPILRDLDTLGGHLGLDDYNLTRAFDIKDNDIEMYNSDTVGVFSRALRGAGHLQAIVSGHRMIMGVQTRGMAEQIIRKAMKKVKDGGEDVALDDMGITSELRAALKRNLDAVAKFGKDGELEELNLLAGDLTPHEMQTIRDAVERGASQIIQRTYIGETGAWAHNGFLKMLLQFRTFSITAVEKQWGRNMRNYGALKSGMYLFGAMSFAAPIYMARVQLKMAGMSRKEREEYADKYLTAGQIGRATLNYASSAGLLGDILDLGGGFASSFGGDGGEEIASYVGARGQGRGDLLGDVMAPGVGLIEDVYKGVHGDGKKLIKALPGSNLPYMQPLVNGITAD